MKSGLSHHTLNAAMADEKNRHRRFSDFYHSFVSPCFAPETLCFARVFGVMVKCSEITDCGKSTVCSYPGCPLGRILPE